MSSKLEYPGLSEAEVRASREKYGENVLTPPARTPMWKLFLEKFSDPIIRILLVALLLSIAVAVYHVATGEAGMSALFEPAGIALAILLATVVGFLFEMSAARKFDILNQVNDDQPVKVVRDGHILEIPKRDVVVGDIVMLNAGDEIPADGVLLSAVSVQVNESSLTGEPMATKTTVEADFDKEATYPSNAVMNGSTMLGGYGVMRVTQVGDATEYGKVYTGSQIENNTQTPLDKQLNTLASFITKASYVIAAIILIARTAIYLSDHPVLDWLNFGSYLLSTAMIAVTVIVVAVPEGLPMSVTLSLAMSMKRMLANNNLVRKMHACETMGAATVICTDKTGTLTQNQMRVSEADFAYAADSNTKEIIYEGIAANSTAHLDEGANGVMKVLGNPTEGALLLWLADQGVDYAALRNQAHVVEQLTFSTERKYMATVVDSPLLKHRVVYVKGAPEYVMNFCSQQITAQGLVPMESSRPAVEAKLLQYQNQAMRTLGFAYALVGDDEPYFVAGHLAPHIRLTFLGVTAIADPVRKEVPEAVAECLQAGIQVKIVTGDTPATAREIARQISLWKPEDGDRNIITGPEFANLDDKTLLERIPDLKVIARARPMDKERLVKLLQSQDEVVAVTGDGTNDAPALNAAQVGPLDGRRHLGGQGGQRHHHHRQLVRQHHQSCAVGTFALSQYPEVHTLPDDHQRGCLSHCPHRGIPGYRVASHRHADAVGEPHYGYLCRLGFGLAAARRAGDARQAPPPERQHRDPRHGQGHHRNRHRLCVAVVRSVAILQARRRHLDSPVRPAALLCQFLQFHARTRRSHAI